MTQPKLILLDEPMAGVNPTLAAQLLEHMQAVREERGVTFLLVEHDLDLVMRACDTVVVMNEGRILTTGTPTKCASTSGSSTPTWARTRERRRCSRWRSSRPATSRSRSCRASRSRLGRRDRGRDRAERGRQVNAAEGRLRPGAGPRRHRPLRRWRRDREPRPRADRARPQLRPQTDNVFPSLSVAENLAVAAGVLPRAGRAAALAAVHDLFPCCASAAASAPAPSPAASGSSRRSPGRSSRARDCSCSTSRRPAWRRVRWTRSSRSSRRSASSGSRS